MRIFMIVLVLTISLAGCGKRNTNIYVGETLTKTPLGKADSSIKKQEPKARDNPIKIQPL